MVSDADLDPSQLLALHLLLEERHVTRAAQRLGVSQSSMSHRLQLLREALGDPLLVRVGSGLVATPRAEQMTRPLAEALAALKAAVASPEVFSPGSCDRKFVIALPDLLAPLLPDLMVEVHRVAPGVSLRVQNVTADLSALLSSGALDLALAPVPFVSERAVSRALGRLVFGAFLRRDHPLAKKKFTLERWLSCGHVAVRIGNTNRNVIEEVLEKRGLQRRVSLEVPTFLSGLLVVAGSDLLMNAPIPLVERLAGPLGLVSRAVPLPLPSIPFALLWGERSREDAAHRWFREMLVRCLRPLFDHSPR